MSAQRKTPDPWRTAARSATVVVLGDLGRSPRIQLHALALAEKFDEVELIGNSGSELLPEVAAHPGIHVHYLPSLERTYRGTQHLPYMLNALVRTIRRGTSLGRALAGGTQPPAVILVQNPPALPTLLITWIAARLRSSKFVVDWHNFGYAMLALRLRPTHPVVHLMRQVEILLGRCADLNFCVSEAMAHELETSWRLSNVRVLHDQPQAGLRKASKSEREAFFRRHDRIFARPQWTKKRPALLVCPSSWSLDEDFDLLLEGLSHYDRRVCAGAPLPPVLCVISGRGPRMKHFARRFAATPLEHVRVKTAWFSPKDYRTFLGSADLGLCVHVSASGFDLPMKILDMFGSGLPVCAFDYGPCIRELVDGKKTGRLFTGPEVLADQLAELLSGFPEPETPLWRLRAAVDSAERPDWISHWRQHAGPWYDAL